jgi:hypothetical protein
VYVPSLVAYGAVSPALDEVAGASVARELEVGGEGLLLRDGEVRARLGYGRGASERIRFPLWPMISIFFFKYKENHSPTCIRIFFRTIGACAELRVHAQGFTRMYLPAVGGRAWINSRNWRISPSAP